MLETLNDKQRAAVIAFFTAAKQSNEEVKHSAMDDAVSMFDDLTDEQKEAVADVIEAIDNDEEGKIIELRRD